MEGEKERLVNPTTGLLEEVTPTLAQETGEPTTEFSAVIPNVSVNHDIFVNPSSEYLEEILFPEEGKDLQNKEWPQIQIKMEPGAVEDSNLIDEPMLSAEISNIGPLLDYPQTTVD